MTTEGTKRKLVAILSADAKGYSRLMGEDEKATVETIKQCRQVMGGLIQQHNGRVIDSPGDNLLAEFSSVVDAVECAVKIQEELKERNEILPENRRMEFRIGIHQGDVIEDEGTIYGDGVIVATRIQELADGGGISLSRTSFDSVKNKLDLGYKYLGKHSVKNISEPVRVYKVLTDPKYTGKVIGEEKRKKIRQSGLFIAILIAVLAVAFSIWNFYFRPPPFEPASIDKMAYPFPDKPSIAVLPFENLSGDPDQEYFSDGMTDDLITDLSKVSGLFVIARNSVFTYKNKSVKIKQISEELGVQYIMEGSVRRVGQRVRINAQLIDATKGHHLWAERYDGSLNDIFALQDSITQKIVTALAVKLPASESGLITQRDTDNLEAYDAYMKALDHHIRWTPEDIKKAAFYYQKAIALDPEYSRAYSAYGYFILSIPQPLSGVPRDEFYKSIPEYLRISMKKPNPAAYVFSSSIKRSLHLLRERYAELRQGSILFPNDPGLLLLLARSLVGIGKPEEAIALAEKAMRLDPRFMASSLCTRGLAYYAMEDSEKAVSYFERGLKHNPEMEKYLPITAAAYAHIGRLQEARGILNMYISKNPWATLRRFFLYIENDDPKFVERFANDLLKAGIQGEPGGYYKIFEKNRLMGDELNELLKDTQSFEYRIENNMICARWTLFGDCCRPVFRNPEGTREEHNEYFIENYAAVNLFSTPDDLHKLIEIKNGLEETIKPIFMKWASDDDGVCREGIFIRKNPPSFSFKYPSDYTVSGLQPGEICRVRSKSTVRSIFVRVAKNQDNPPKTLSRSAESYKRIIQSKYDREVKIIYNRALPEDTYGEKYPAQEYGIEFKFGGSPLTAFYNVIINNDYRIIMTGIVNRSHARDDIEKIVKPIFHSIDLDP